MTNDAVTVRRMTAGDVAAVAGLHVASWRSAYRGIMADAYLDDSAPANRLAHWAERLGQPSPGQAGFVAERAGVPIGFAFVFGNDDAHYGTLLDNLHMHPDARGAGIGRMLLARVAQEIADRGWPPGLYLWVFAANPGARRFYERHGGVAVEHADLPTSDGVAHPAVRYAWADASVLV